MVVKTAKDIEKLQQQMSEQVGRYRQERQAGGGAGMMPEDPQVLIERARASLEAAIRDRDEGLRMAERRVERWKSEVASLENILKQTDRPVEEAQEKRTPKAKSRAGDGG
ncbi:MAG: hypothetical protein IPK78_19930 [Rhodospirillales bacterium]|nr:hypothetical protein [Rhodospirillales bacterium]